MKRLLFTIALLAAVSASAAERTVSIRRDFGSLYGSLLVPDSGAETVAIIIAGSGPTDRNCNNHMGMRPNSYLYLAQELEKAGIASLRYDKRAIGQSVYSNNDKTNEVLFDDFIGDAVAWADYLAEQDFKHIVLIGHSEGALIALCAAQQAKKTDAVVSLAGAGYPLDEVIKVQLAAQLTLNRMDLLMSANSALDSLKRGQRVDSYPQELASLFHPSIQPFLISTLRYDPRREIHKLRIPVLIINGDNDIQITTDNAEALHKALPQAKKVIIKDMTHTLKSCAGRSQTEQIGAYTDSSLPLSPELAPAIVKFIEAWK